MFKSKDIKISTIPKLCRIQMLVFLRTDTVPTIFITTILCIQKGSWVQID